MELDRKKRFNMKSDHLHLNSDKTQFIWVGSRQQLASGFSKTSPIVTCLLLASRQMPSWHSRRTWSRLQHAVSISFANCGPFDQILLQTNAIMLIHVLIASRVDYCNSILFQTATVHLRPLQSVMNAAARLVAKKRKSHSITPTLRDTLHWLLVRESRTNRLQALSSRLQMSPPACRHVPRSFQFRQCQHVAPTVGRSRWPDSTEDQNCSALEVSLSLVHHCGTLCCLTWNSRLYPSHSFVAS